jgi:DNA-binding NarL/FixJ family response regulator
METQPDAVISVLIVDDDPTCREGLRQLLSLAPDLKVVGEASDAEEAYRIGRRLRPDVVVIDADLPKASCVEMMSRLGRTSFRPDQHPSFICLAVYPDQHDAALQAGAVRFLRKDGSRQELVEAVRAAARARANGRDFPAPIDPAQQEVAQGS